MSKIVDGVLYVRHLSVHEEHVVVDVVELIIKAGLHTLKALPHSLMCSPMLASSDEFLISIKYGITLIARVIRSEERRVGKEC